MKLFLRIASVYAVFSLVSWLGLPNAFTWYMEQGFAEQGVWVAILLLGPIGNFLLGSMLIWFYGVETILLALTLLLACTTSSGSSRFVYLIAFFAIWTGSLWILFKFMMYGA